MVLTVKFPLQKLSLLNSKATGHPPQDSRQTSCFACGLLISEGESWQGWGGGPCHRGT